MKSYYLFIELSGLQQFLAVKDPVVSESIRDCRRIVNNVRKAEMMIQASFIIFQIDAEMDISRAVLESALKVLENLNQHSEELHEYSMMLISRDEGTAESIINKVKQDYYISCVDSAIIAEDEIIESSGIPAMKIESTAFSLLHSDSKQSAENNGIYDDKLIEQEEVVRLIEILVPEFEQKRISNRIILKGDSDLVLHCNLDAALKKIDGKQSLETVIINQLEGDSGTIMPFYRSIDPGFIENAGDYLSGIELKSWNNRITGLDNIGSDYPEESFFITYCLYLKAKMKSFESQQLPALILFEGIEFSSLDTMNYLVRILDFLSAETEPVLIFFENQSYPIKEEIREHSLFSDAVEFGCCSDPKLSVNSLSLKYILKRLLFTVYLTEGLFNRIVLQRFLTGFGYEQMEIKAGLEQLERAGCIRNDRYPHVLKSSISKDFIDEISSRDDIYKAVAAFISRNVYTSNDLDYGLAAERLMPQISDCEVYAAVYACLTRLLDYGSTLRVNDYLLRCSGMPANLLTALKLRSALIDGNREKCKEILSNSPEKPESPVDLESTVLLIETSRYFHALNEYPRALDYIKKALIYLQDEDLPRLEGMAFIELGFIMMCKGKLLEASEYLGLAVEKLIKTGDAFNLMKAYIFSAIGQYLWGSIDEALNFTEKAIEKASAGNFENWYFFTEFFRCRLYFELGRYYDAEKLLSGCLLRNEIYRDEKRRKLFLAWTARACIYQGKVYRGLNMLKSLKEDPEVLEYLAEAYFFHGDLENAVMHIEKAESMRDYFAPVFIPLENIKWDNGYISVEDRALRSAEGTGVMLHITRAMHAYFLGLSGDKEYGIEILFSLTRDQKISEFDPFNRLYFYFYCILYDKSSNTDLVDKLTLISKALKYLQQTSSRINTPSVRQEFMVKNYWNSKLVNEARNEKLI